MGQRPFILTVTTEAHPPTLYNTPGTTPAEVERSKPKAQKFSATGDYDRTLVLAKHRRARQAKTQPRWKQAYREGGFFFLVFFLCKLGPYLGIQHNFWSPVPTCGYVLRQEPCVIMVWVCNTGQAKITDLREKESDTLGILPNLISKHHKHKKRQQ